MNCCQKSGNEKINKNESGRGHWGTIYLVKREGQNWGLSNGYTIRIIIES